jgi:hypothetical protein
MNAHDLATKPQLVSRDGRYKETHISIAEMAARFNAYDKETHEFVFFGNWIEMSWAEREARQAEIDAKHGYKHGWIIVNGQSFDRYQAFPGEVFANVWD